MIDLKLPCVEYVPHPAHSICIRCGVSKGAHIHPAPIPPANEGQQPEIPQERIVAAAIRENGIILTGPHHHQIIRYSVPLLGIKTSRGEQGFITNTNRFVSRIEAAGIAFSAGQVAVGIDGLFSEQLWSIPDDTFCPARPTLLQRERELTAERDEALEERDSTEAHFSRLHEYGSEQQKRAESAESQVRELTVRVAELEAQLSDAKSVCVFGDCKACRGCVERAESEAAAAQGYATRLFEELAPQCKPIPDIMGVLTQLDNWCAGTRGELAAARAEVARYIGMPCANRNHEGFDEFSSGLRNLNELVPLDCGPQEWMGQEVAFLALRIKERLK